MRSFNQWLACVIRSSRIFLQYSSICETIWNCGFLNSDQELICSNKYFVDLIMSLIDFSFHNCWYADISYWSKTCLAIVNKGLVKFGTRALNGPAYDAFNRANGILELTWFARHATIDFKIENWCTYHSSS